MKTAKILEIWKSNEWEWPHWKIYYINLKLDNDELISLWKKSPDAFKVGDTVNYEDYTDDKWRTKQREVKVNNFQPKSNYNPEIANRWAMVWMSVKLAFDKVYNDEKDLEKAKKLSKEIFNIAMELYNWNKPEKIEDSTENDDLPF